MEKQKKYELVDEIALRSHVNKKDVKIVIDETFEYIKECLLNDEEVNITNFGVLYLKDRKERVGVNPQTKEKITLKQRKTLKVRLSKNFKKELSK